MGKSEVVVIVMVVLAAWIGSAVAFRDVPTARSLLRRDTRTISHAEKELQEASKKGDVKVVKKLLDGNVNANVMSEHGMTPLMVASKNNHTPIVETLVTSGIDTEIRTSAGSTALWLAAEAGNAEIIQVLVEGGADQEAHNDDGVSPLFVATEKGHVAAVKVLLSMGCNPDSAAKKPPMTPLGQAAASGFTKVATVLLDAGASIHGGPKSMAPLGIAAETGDLEVAKLLMKRGADVNRGDSWDGSTPLHCAARKCQFDGVAWLVAQGARLDVKDGKGKTAEAVLCTALDLGDLPVKEVHERKGRMEKVLEASKKNKKVPLLTNSADSPPPDEEAATKTALKSPNAGPPRPRRQKSSKDADTSKTAATEDPNALSRDATAPSPLSAASTTFVQRGGSISAVDPTAAPTPSESSMEDRTIVAIVCAAAGVMVLVSIVYLFGIRRWGEGRDHDDLVEKLEKAVQAAGGKSASTNKKGSRRPTRSATMDKLSEEMGRAEMERMGSTPLNFADEGCTSGSSGGTPIVPPLRLNQVEELKRKKREANILVKKPKSKTGVSQKGEGRQDREHPKIRVIDSRENPVRPVQRTKVTRSSSNNHPRRLAGSTDVVKRAFSSEKFSHSRVLDVKMGDFGVNDSFDRADPEEPVVESLSIYCDPEGAPELGRKGNSHFKVHIDEFPLPDFDSTTDQSDKLFEQPSVTRRLSLTGSF